MKTKLSVLLALFIVSLVSLSLLSGCTSIHLGEVGGDLAFFKRACTPGADDHLLITRHWRWGSTNSSQLYYPFEECMEMDGKIYTINLPEKSKDRVLQYKNIKHTVNMDTIWVTGLHAAFEISFPKVANGNPGFPQISYCGNQNGVRVFQDLRNVDRKRFFEVAVPSSMSCELVIRQPYDAVVSDKCGMPFVEKDAMFYIAKYVLVFDYQS